MPRELDAQHSTCKPLQMLLLLLLHLFALLHMHLRDCLPLLLMNVP